MSKQKIEIIKKIFILVVASFILSLILEVLFFNYRSLFKQNKNSENNILLADCDIVENGEEWESATYTFEEPTYVAKLILEASPQYNIGYGLSVTYLNPFEKEEQKYIDDTFVYGNNYHCTYIGEKITEITIIMPKIAEVTKLSFFNDFQFNKYRVAVFFCIIFIIGNCFALSQFYQERLEFLFILIGGLFGVVMILMQGPIMQGWDGETHFNNIYEMTQGEKVKNSIALQLLKQTTVITYNTLEEKLQNNQFYNANATYNSEMEEINDTRSITYNKWGYIPIALLYKIGLILNLNFNRCYMLGALGNLILYLLAYAFAIKIAQSGKMIIFCIGLMPTPLFIATTYTYDSFVNACIVLGFTLIYNCIIKDGQENKKWFVPMMAILLIGIGSMPKAVYIPMVLFALCLLQGKTDSERAFNKIIFWGCITVFLIGLSTFGLPTLESVLSGDAVYASDQRGGDTSMLLQLMSIIRHPVAFLRLLINNIFSIDNFRNYGSIEWDNHLMTNLCFLNMGMYGIMPDKYVYLTLLYIIGLILFGKEKPVERKYRIAFYAVTLSTVMLIWTALYLAFTSIGENKISGVQARYYLPLVAPLLMIFPSPKIKIKGANIEMYQQRIFRIFSTCAVFFLSYCVYFLMFKKTCM